MGRPSRPSRDLSGQPYNDLTVEHYVGRKPRSDGLRYYHLWLCRCVCGSAVVVRGDQLRSGDTKSCGCLGGRLRTRHGYAKQGAVDPVFKIWCRIVERCTKPNSALWSRYGGRGITMSPLWMGKDGFVHFITEIGPRPSKLHSVDRIDNNKGYEPGNVRWATRREQMRNTRSNRRLTLDGTTRCVAEWAEILGIPVGRLRSRLRSGWDAARALTTPVMTRGG